MALPIPIGRQREVLCLPAKGHFVILGTAGSGKTTLAILRSAYLSDPSTDHHGKTLPVTFNRALVAYLKHLQDRRLAHVVMENHHQFARGYLSFRDKMLFNAICDPDWREILIGQAVKQVSERYALVSSDHKKSIVQQPKEVTRNHHAIIFLKTRSLEAAYDNLKRFGATIQTPISQTREQRFFRCFDPDGNLVEIFEVVGNS
jgi:uncharacterized glyoxalase superfamily protein PhnB